ncbi:hypothetical protein D8I24_4208 [Cupriavidus necator H850]|nr:hypothetical protein D8I24_4208 [Cupriavidus necator H850]
MRLAARASTTARLRARWPKPNATDYRDAPLFTLDTMLLKRFATVPASG